jgi:hypothetical protein
MPLDSLRLCAVSVDLDEIPNYHAIYGLPDPESPSSTAVYDIALSRLEHLARHHAIPLTLFAIGADLQRERSAEALRALAARGHEIANHSFDHRYDLTRLEPAEARRQIELGAAAIERAVGRRPAGFRSPGYVTSDVLLEALIDTGHLYDSSVFPCPPYFAAKAVAMAWISVRGRSSRSVQDHPRVLLSPTRPYRPGKPYHRPGNLPLIELPVQVTRGPRLPYIGTSLALSGPRRAAWLTRLVLGAPVINLELHGIDVLDASDGLHRLRGHAPDVAIDYERKMAIFGGAFAQLKAAGYRFVTLQQAAADVAQLL